MKKIIGIVVGLLLIGAISKTAIQDVKKPSPDNQQKSEQGTVKRDFNVAYGNHPRQTMRVILPEETTTETPVVLIIHGGAWTSGDKKDMLTIQKKLAERDIASVAMNYRYASASVHYPDMMSDVHQAVTYISGHTDDWQVAPDKLVLSGISAGAHMALLYSYAYDTGKTVDAVISLAGPTDLTNTTWLDQVTTIKLMKNLEFMVGQDYVSGKPLAESFTMASPSRRVRNVPTLMVHGTKDTIVSYTQSEYLAQVLSDKKIPNKLVSIPGANHDIGLLNPVTAQKILQEMVTWINQYAK